MEVSQGCVMDRQTWWKVDEALIDGHFNDQLAMSGKQTPWFNCLSWTSKLNFFELNWTFTGAGIYLKVAEILKIKKKSEN